MVNAKSKLKKCFILTYLDYNEIINALRYLSCYKFAMIKHDKDRYTDYEKDNNNYIIHDIGEEKKHHWHICAWFNTSITAQFIANRFDINVENLEILNEFQAIPYLIHFYEDETKYKYNKNDIVSYGININDYFLKTNTLELKKDSMQLKIFNFCKSECISCTTDLIIFLENCKYYDLLEWSLIHTHEVKAIIELTKQYNNYFYNLPY